MKHVTIEQKHQEPFRERALRADLARGHSATYAEFRFGDPYPLQVAVESNVIDVSQGKNSEEGMETPVAVYASLKKCYPRKESELKAAPQQNPG